jgi:hypothetical protein
LLDNTLLLHGYALEKGIRKGFSMQKIVIVKGTIYLVLGREKLLKNTVNFTVCTPNESDAFVSRI